jgi:hypothetical protein
VHVEPDEAEPAAIAAIRRLRAAGPSLRRIAADPASSAGALGAVSSGGSNPLRPLQLPSRMAVGPHL